MKVRGEKKNVLIGIDTSDTDTIVNCPPLLSGTTLV